MIAVLDDGCRFGQWLPFWTIIAVLNNGCRFGQWLPFWTIAAVVKAVFCLFKVPIKGPFS